MDTIQMIPLTALHPHPQNPRFAPREEVVAQIVAQLTQTAAFDPAHALIVRPLEEGQYQIIAGHHRVLAAERAGMTAVPCWVREMSDDEAYMALVLDNAQSELLPLEEGMHALRSGIKQAEYAKKIGKEVSSLQPRWQAARVIEVIEKNININISEFAPVWLALSAIHVAPAWLWEELVGCLMEEKWAVEKTREKVRPLKDVEAPPDWSDTAEIAGMVVQGHMRPKEVAEFASMAENCRARLARNGEDVERFRALLSERLAAACSSALSEVSTICLQVEQEQAALIRERQQADLFRRKRDEQVRARIARLRRNVSLEEWQTLAADEQHALLHLGVDDDNPIPFNKQDTTAIEWAQFSWNPVTGCLHGCPYCYARNITLTSKFSKVFPYGFAPTLRPLTVLAPRHMSVPLEAATDTRFRNVFTCSMADLFGRWVPTPWIDAILQEMRDAPQWNFLCLTKFPKRAIEFDLPPNAWMGTTVDLQARVKAAEDAFASITAGVRWLSLEPLLEPLTFTHLDRFDWMVIGGASATEATSDSPATPEWRPPFAWIEDLVGQAREAGCKVYFKTNLLRKRLLEMPFDAPMPEQESLPKVFHYLKAADAGKDL